MKGIIFWGTSLKVVRQFPGMARKDVGLQLDRVQRDLEPIDWKPMKSVGAGVREIRIQYEGQYRVVYIANLEEKVYVLHAFKKKSQKTSQRDLTIARRSLKDIQAEQRL